METASFKYRIYPNKEQKEYFSKVFGCGRFVNFQYKQDYQWFKNLYDGIFSFKK